MPSIQVLHEYFGGPWMGLSFRPDANSAEAIRKHQLLFRVSPDGLFVGASDPENIPEIPLLFFAYPVDAEYAYYTQLPPRGLVSHYVCDGKAGSMEPIESKWELFRDILPHRPPCFVVEFAVGLEDGSYAIPLKTKSFRWKYVLNPAFPHDGVEIIDAGPAAHLVAFERLSESPHQVGACWITAGELALQALPSQRFQLRESATGKVIMKRLPCATGKFIAKETTADGLNVLAAEVYINP